jgi:hypothetical protein
VSDYKPSSIVVSLCKKLQAIPVAEAVRLDGTVVIVVADGRKLTFSKDDTVRAAATAASPVRDGITRTSTGPIGQGGVKPTLPTSATSRSILEGRDAEDPATPKAAVVDSLEVAKPVKVRKPRENKKKEQHAE